MTKPGKKWLDGRVKFGLRGALLLAAVGVAVAVAGSLPQL
jgi:hypothetical protein